MTEKKQYCCPMHPEVVGKKGDKCTKCGMALVLKDEESHGGHDHLEHHAMMAEDFKKRFFYSIPLSISILLLSPKIQQWLGFTFNFPGKVILLFALASVMVFWAAKPFFVAARGELKSGNWGMMTLVSLAVLSGYFFSVAASVYDLPESFYWEVATLILAFLFGHWMEMRAVVGTGGALKELSKLIPPTAHLIKGTKTKDVNTEELKKGNLVLVRPGEKIPADGIVQKGSSTVNESLLTGESVPIAKTTGAEVIGGSINNDGSLTIEITKTGNESAIAQITTLISNAQMTKPSVQNLADRAANWLTITAIVVGTSTFLYWFFINPQGAVFAATLAITVVVITCPHALGLAIPTVTTITSSLAAKNGILIRDMKGLEIARKLDYVVFDKTGTLTEGNFGVSKIISYDKSVKQSNILALAASVEHHSQHPIARAIVREAEKRKVKINPADNFKSISGKGAEGKIKGKRYFVGKHGEASVAVVKGKKVLGEIVLSDKIKSESREAINKLHGLGIKVAMLTGDKSEVAKKVAKELNIDKVFSEVLPKDKVKKIKELQKEGTVAMVGDGVNDAAALTQAHTGIAIGAGTDVAIESAEIVLVKNNPSDVVKIINLSKKVNTKMLENLAWATGYNLIAIPAAAGVFISTIGLTLRPEWGALLMSASSLIVVANALRLRGVDLTN